MIPGSQLLSLEKIWHSLIMLVLYTPMTRS